MMVFLLLLFLFLIPILAVSALFMTERGSALKRYIHFFVAGLESGFKPAQIVFLGKVGKATGLDDLTKLFWSLPALDRCTAEIVRRGKYTGTENDPETQLFLSRLYSYRTKVELEQAQKKHGLESTREILPGQRVRILLRGIGVFTSKVTRNNSKFLTLEFPYSPKIPATSIDWTNRAVGVYFWRHDDAGYVFDSVVIPDPSITGRAVLHLAHSVNLLRSQKRKSIRAKCQIYAQMYLVKPGRHLDSALEPEPGMKCLIEDLSEDGAMVLIGGKAVRGMKIKLQFMVYDVLVVMAGETKAVEYNDETNQSRIHFESEELSPRIRNAILTFVYNVLPEEEKEELDAIRLTEQDGLEDSESTAAAGPEGEPGQAGQVEELPELPDFSDLPGKPGPDGTR